MGRERLIQRLKVLNQDLDFEEYVRELLELNKLEGDAVKGIARQIVSKGVETLTEIQIKTFANNGLWEHHYLEECGRCATEVIWSEMSFAVDHGYCPYCQHIIDKE